jgi:hypothetical protein
MGALSGGGKAEYKAQLPKADLAFLGLQNRVAVFIPSSEIDQFSAALHASRLALLVNGLIVREPASD